jgi:hypothetical protein
MERAAQATPAGTQPDSDSPARMGVHLLDELGFYWGRSTTSPWPTASAPRGAGTARAAPSPIRSPKASACASWLTTTPTPYREIPPGRPAPTRPDVPHPIPNPARTGAPCQPQPRLQPRRSTRPGIPSMRSPRSSWVPTAVSWRTPSRSSRPGTLSLRHGMTCKLSSVTCSPSRTIAPGSRVPDPGRPPDVSTLTSPELERIRRQLAASLALTRSGSPAQVPILAHPRHRHRGSPASRAVALTTPDPVHRVPRQEREVPEPAASPVVARARPQTPRLITTGQTAKMSASIRRPPGAIARLRRTAEPPSRVHHRARGATDTCCDCGKMGIAADPPPHGRRHTPLLLRLRLLHRADPRHSSGSAALHRTCLRQMRTSLMRSCGV